MMATVPGVGLLIANDLLSDVSLKLYEPLVSTRFSSAVAANTFGTVDTADTSAIYVGAQLVAGVVGTNAEVVTVLLVVSGTSFTAKFLNAHPAGDPIVGATFPVYQTAGDFYFSQLEMLTYLSNAVNDFLSRVALAYNVADVSYGPSSSITALPSDCIEPVRVAAFGVGLRETSQSNLDSVDYQWSSEAYAEPIAYYRDKIGIQNLGIWPVAANTTLIELVYRQRAAELMGLGDGFLIPDVFLPTIKARVLSFAYSKDGSQCSPSNAKFWDGRWESGIALANIILGIVQDQSGQ